NGNIRMDDKNYDIRPAETSLKSRDTFDSPDLRGIPYVRRHQAKYQKDAAYVSEKEVEQGLRELVRFPQKHDKHTRSPVTYKNVSYIKGEN
ncbi:hypothetical protein ACJMK2_011048, partial [Sinanodonta woodiana]